MPEPRSRQSEEFSLEQRSLTPEKLAEQRAVRNFLQEAGQQEIDDAKISRLAMQTRRYIRSETIAGKSPWQRLFAPLFGWRPVSVGLAGALAVAAFLWLQPAEKLPLADVSPTVLTGNGAEVEFYLEEHAIASGSEALNQGHIVTSIFLNEL
jgi:hypothetical protein